jgi:hypothetical protein
MNVEDREKLNAGEGSRWSTCEMLLWGALGTKSNGERRYKTRNALAASVVVCWALFAFAMHLHPKIIVSTTVFLAAFLTSYIAWELRRYLTQLDELARRMQLEAMALTYLTGFVLAVWFGVLLTFMVLFSHAPMHWPLKSLLLASPFLYFLLEPIRAGWLYYLSRRY